MGPSFNHIFDKAPQIILTNTSNRIQITAGTVIFGEIATQALITISRGNDQKGSRCVLHGAHQLNIII